MSESNSGNTWAQDWEALQRQYLNAWSELIAKAPAAAATAAGPFGAGPFAASPFASSPFAAGPFGASPFAGMPGAGASAQAGWPDAMQQWSQIFGAGTGQSDTAERLMASAKSYLAMIQSMFGAAAAQPPGWAAAPANPLHAWFESLRGAAAPSPAGFAMPGMDASMLDNPFAKALRDMAGQGAKGFTAMPEAFAPLIEQLRRDGLSWLKLPAFGVGREHQEHYQKTALAFVEYQQALQNYNALMAGASQRGFALFEVKLAERGENMRSIDSLRALYDLWVDAAEEAYAETALSEEFAKVYGELANAQMRVRAQVHTQVERVSTDLGMPTRSELNSLHKRVHELRRELRDGNEAQVDTTALQAQIGVLREEVRALRQNLDVLQKNSKPAERKITTQIEPKKSAPVTPKIDKVVVAKKASVAPSTANVAAQPQVLPHTSRPREQRRRIQGSATRPRLPAPVIRPRPLAADDGKSSGKVTSFGDAIAAMRQRVSAKSARQKSVAARFSKPSKQHGATDKAGKSGKKKKP